MRLRRVLWNPCKEYTQTGRPDTPSEGIRTTYPGRNCTRLPPFTPWLPRTFHPGCSRPEFRSRMGEEAFQLLRTDVSGSSNSTYPESFANNFVQCCGVLLKLPDICHRYFGIFCFRYLLSKSPKSPCNPPIIGFLSY